MGVSTQTGLAVGYVEQLSTFGDRDRERTQDGTRNLSVAYLGLVKEAQPAPVAAWIDAYDLLPWEDRRTGMPATVGEALLPALTRWAGRDAARKHRVRANFGDRRCARDPIRVLERYELLYEVGLVPEHGRDRGLPARRAAARRRAAFDHRRIVATALGRRRGKLKYRPVVFAAPARNLHVAAAATHGRGAHRHACAQAELPAPGRERPLSGATRALERPARGRPAKLFRFRKEVVRARLY